MAGVYRDTLPIVTRLSRLWLVPLGLLPMLACDPEPVMTAVPAPEAAVAAVTERREVQAARTSPEAMDAGPAYRKAEGVYVDVPHLGGRLFEAARDDVESQLGALVSQGPTSDGALAYVFQRGTVRVADGNVQMIEIPLPEPLRRSEALTVLGFAPVASTWRSFANEFRVGNVQGFRRIRMIRTERGAEEIARVECWKFTNGDR